MIENLKIKTAPGSNDFDISDGIFATYQYDGISHELKIADVSEYWEYANEEELFRIEISEDGTYIRAIFRVKTGWCIIAFWDAKTGNLIHISDGNYEIANQVFDGDLYVLSATINYGADLDDPPFTYTMSIIKFGTMDVEKELEVDKGFKFEDYDAHAAKISGESVDLYVSADAYCIEFRDKKYLIDRG